MGVDTANLLVTYHTEGSDTVTRSSVASAKTLAKLTAMKVGQKVILKCRTFEDGKTIVEDVKKPVAWWRYALTIALVAWIIKEIVDFSNSNLGDAPL